jgi:hypothetical protein
MKIMKTTYIYIAILLLVVTGSAVLAQSSAPRASPSMKLSTSVLEQRYIRGDDDLCAVELELNLQFLNTGHSPLLVTKYLAGISHVWVGKSETLVKEKKFEQSSNLSIFYVPKGEIDEIELGDFSLLQPGDSFEAVDTVVLFTPYDAGKTIQGSISVGKHVLQVKILPVFWNQEISENLRKKFHQYGTLWDSPIVSEPMEFTIHKGEKCSD